MHRQAFQPVLAPAEEAARTYWRGADTIFKSTNPGVKSAFRLNLEYTGFALRQMRASMDLPVQLAACKTPVDATDCAIRFWMAAFEDFASANGRVISAWSAALPEAARADVKIDDWNVKVPAFQESRERDRIDLNVPAQSRQPSGARAPASRETSVAAAA
ncbi:MAG: hypothetical protein AAF732_03205 [Pseudomonadota bacterium]